MRYFIISFLSGVVRSREKPSLFSIVLCFQLMDMTMVALSVPVTIFRCLWMPVYLPFSRPICSYIFVCFLRFFFANAFFSLREPLFKTLAKPAIHTSFSHGFYLAIHL
jgi:hypothetical protein